MATAQKPKRGEKVAFIRQHPSVSAGEVVDLAKKHGIKISTALVYNCRATDKKQGKRRGKKAAARNGVAHGADLGNGLVAVAGVVKKLGGVENVRQALKLIEQVSAP